MRISKVLIVFGVVAMVALLNARTTDQQVQIKEFDAKAEDEQADTDIEAVDEEADCHPYYQMSYENDLAALDEDADEAADFFALMENDDEAADSDEEAEWFGKKFFKKVKKHFSSIGRRIRKAYRKLKRVFTAVNRERRKNRRLRKALRKCRRGKKSESE